MKAIISVLAVLLIFVATCPSTLAWKQDRFMVTFWCPPPATEEALANVAAEGYNLTWAPADGLDLVEKHGLRALLQDGLLTPGVLGDPTRKAKLDALVDRVKNHPAMEGYFITDEPGAGAFSDLGRLVAYLRQRDPRHLAYINIFPTYANEQQLGVSAADAEKQTISIPSDFSEAASYSQVILLYNEHLRQYVRTVKPELISYDHYHFFRNDVDMAQYFLNLALIRECAQNAGLPFLNIIQACTIEPAWRLVNKHELRWLVFTTLAYGGRGISYFLYWGPKSYGGLYQDGVRTPLALDVAAINADLKTIGPEMMKLDSTAVYQTEPLPAGSVAFPADSQYKVTGGGFVLGLFRNAEKNDFFMIVNRDYRKNSAAHIALPQDVRTLREFNRKSGRWQTYTHVTRAQPVTIALQPGDGRLFRVVK